MDVVHTKMVAARWQVVEQTSTEESPKATGRILVVRWLPLLCTVCPGYLWLRNWERLSFLQGTWFLKLRRPEKGQMHQV